MIHGQPLLVNWNSRFQTDQFLDTFIALFAQPNEERPIGDAELLRAFADLEDHMKEIQSVASIDKLCKLVEIVVIPNFES